MATATTTDTSYTITIWWIHTMPPNRIPHAYHRHGLRNARNANATTVDEWGAMCDKQGRRIIIKTKILILK